MDIGSENKMEIRIISRFGGWVEVPCHGMRNIEDEQFTVGTWSSLMTMLSLRCPLDIQGKLSS